MKKLLILVIEGCSLEYISLENTPNIYRIAKDGFCKCVKAAVPTINSVNHMTILSGRFPCEHGVIGNSAYHPETGETEHLPKSGYRDVETILSYMHQRGASTALLSARGDVLEYLGRNVDFGVSVENPKDILVRFLDMPSPPNVESLHASTWILEACYRLIKKNSIDTIYCTTNDYMMQQYAPDTKEALRHMRKIDDWLGKIYDLDHDRQIYITGGFGMSSRPRLLNLQAVLARNGYDVVCHSPCQEESGNLGMRMLYLGSMSADRETDLIRFLEEAPFVDIVSPKDEAAKRFNLPADQIGDYLVFAADGYTFADFEGEEKESEGSRSNGSLLERATPLIAVNAAEVPEKYRYSRDIVKIIMEALDRT